MIMEIHGVCARGADSVIIIDDKNSVELKVNKLTSADLSVEEARYIAEQLLRAASRLEERLKGE